VELFISIYMATFARKLFVQFGTIVVLSFAAALVISWNAQAISLEPGRGLVRYALTDGLSTNDGWSVAVAALIIGYYATVIAFLLMFVSRLLSDKSPRGTSLVTTVKDGMPKIYVAVLVCLLPIYPLYFLGILKQSFFPEAGLFGYLATFFIYGYGYFLILGDLVITAVSKLRRTPAGEQNTAEP
jgi:hypothetical protein